MQSPHPQRGLHACCALAALLLATACVGGVPNVATQRAEHDRAMYYQQQSQDPEIGHSKAAPTGQSIAWSSHARSGRRHLAIGDTQGAEAEFLLSLAATDAFPAKDVRSRAAVRNLARLADIYWVANDYAATIRITPTLIRGVERVYGPRDRRLGVDWGRLGRARLATGDLVAAEADLQRSLREHASHEIRLDQEETDSLIALARSYERQGKLGQAETLFRRAVEDLDARSAETRPMAIALNALAWFYVSHDRFAEALPIARRALDISTQRSLSADDRAAIHDTLASALAGLGKNTEAEEQFALAVRASRGDPRILRNLASFLRDIGRSEDASAIDAEADKIESRRSADGGQRPATPTAALSQAPA